ncbi:MAG: glucans biosynthesis glucosyltransferase MdoH [Proteobacteria bacterium]|nr:glucans biosynthesis glucosyltransferase MdoH [Pseudomonadota bacterium]
MDDIALVVPPVLAAPGERLGARRALVLVLNLGSWIGLGLVMAHVIGGQGWTPASIAIMALFLIGLPWTLLAFWNAVIGFVILRGTRDPASYTNVALRATVPDAPISRRTAICIAIRHEDVERVATRLAVMQGSLAATGAGAMFAFHVLSDSSRPDSVAAELAAFGNAPGVTYRRRPANTGFKAGNLRDFALAAGSDAHFMLVLDADSLMSGAAILRLVRVMEANPGLGILQTLVTGLPATSAFARIFQFGMRHGMRTHTTGIAWWQGSSGPYWGHNALIRLSSFVAHCELPVLPGRSPLSGHILSHDQVEAALMRAAGMEVRVIADEFGSWEENPPRLPDFIRRDLRWAQGNLQYLGLVTRPGLRAMGRFQLCNAIAMYLGAPTSLLMLVIGLVNGLTRGHAGAVPQTLAFSLYFGFLLIGFAPRLLGVLDIALRPAERRRWGGLPRLLAGAATDGLFTLMIGPVMMVSQARFIAGLALGRRIMWEAQRREAGDVPWAEAIRGLWPQLLFGLLFAVALWRVAPGAIPWALPTLAGSLLAIPFACVTAEPRLGRWMVRRGLCAIPDEFDPAPEVLALDESRAERSRR